jgi:hypothetical protein
VDFAYNGTDFVEREPEIEPFMILCKRLPDTKEIAVAPKPAVFRTIPIYLPRRITK